MPAHAGRHRQTNREMEGERKKQDTERERHIQNQTKKEMYRDRHGETDTHTQTGGGLRDIQTC